MQGEAVAASRAPVGPRGNPSGALGMTTAPPLFLQLTLPPDADAVRVALARISGALLAQGIAESDTGTAELVLAEVLNNIVEHAFAGEDGAEIRIQCAADLSRLRFEIGDNGRALPDGALPDAQLPEIGDCLENLPEGGFGWFLIQGLAQDVTYERLKGANRLSFAIARPDGLAQA